MKCVDHGLIVHRRNGDDQRLGGGVHAAVRRTAVVLDDDRNGSRPVRVRRRGVRENAEAEVDRRLAAGGEQRGVAVRDGDRQRLAALVGRARARIRQRIRDALRAGILADVCDAIRS